MSLTVDIEGECAAEVARDLRDWIHDEGLEGLAVSLAPGKPVLGTQGAELATGLLLQLNTKAVTELVRSLRTWVKVRKPKVKLMIKSGNKQFTLETENTPIDQVLVSNLMALVREAS